MFSPAVENLVAQLTRLPGVGQRTAQRLAFHLLQVPKAEALALAEAIDPDDPELLADMVLAAVNEALRSAQHLMESKLGGAMGGLGNLGLPGF